MGARTDERRAMRGRPRGTTALSDWEMDELLMHARAGWRASELAHYYGVSERTVFRYLRRARRDSGPATRNLD